MATQNINSKYNSLKILTSHSNLDYWYGPYNSITDAFNRIPNGYRAIGLTVGIKRLVIVDGATKDEIIEYQWKKGITNNDLVIKNPDDLYGPYPNRDTALAAVRPEDRSIGMTIGIMEDDELVEYLWKNDTNNDNLERKVEDINLTLELMGQNNYTVELNQPIVVPIKITGLNGILAVLIYLIISGLDVTYQTIQNVAKDVVYNLTISLPSAVGNYSFKIMVIDAYSKAAKTANGLGYIQINVKYGSIQVNWNFSEITNLLIKNAASIAKKEIYGTFNAIEGYQINAVSLVSTTHGTDVLTENSYLLIQNVPLNTSQKILMPNTEILVNYEGLDLRIKIDYEDEELVEHFIITDVICMLLSSRSINFLTKNTITSIYEEMPTLLILNAQTGNGSTLVALSSTEDSDFVYTGNINSYIDSSIYITPKKLETGTLEKNGAIFKFNYTFLVDSVPISGSYIIEFPTTKIKKKPDLVFYIPELNSNVKKYDLIDTQTDTKISENIYYKDLQLIIVPSSYNSFLLDLYCKLNKTDTDTIFIKIEGLIDLNWVELARIDDNVVSIGINRLNSFTPVNEWKQIGIGYLLTEKHRFVANETVCYNAIFIDGILIKNIIADNKMFSNIRITFQNVLLSDSFLYYNNMSNFISLNPSGNLSDPIDNYLYSIIYLNYKSHNLDFSEPELLPILSLTPLNEDNIDTFINLYSDENVKDYFNELTPAEKLAKLYKVVGLTKVRFGTVADGLNKAKSEAEYIDTNHGTLFNLTTDLKKELLKKYGVLCIGSYNGNTIGGDTCITQVNTQGTSTLNYAVPNFKFKFFSLVEKTDSETGTKSLSKTKVKVSTLVPGYKESTLTAKADYMDSSHLNNTPTCIYYNNILLRIKNDNESQIKVSLSTDVYYKYSDMMSPSANKNKLDAVLGIPIVINVNETINDKINTLALGSFMLNIDKTGDSLGFDANKEEGQDYLIDPDNEDNPFCLSFEGTSNFDNAGLSSRFINGSNLPYIDNVDSLSEHTSLTKLWCEFFSEGLEYRFPEPDSGIYDKKKKTYMPLSHFKYLYKMWSWVSKSATELENKTLSVTEYKTQFLEHFNLLYSMLYFIDIMVFGQTDNLGKNSMFDTWDGRIWFPRPYDLDSQVGLDNNGFDEVPSFVEIKPEFSLDFKEGSQDEDYIAYKEVVLPYEGINCLRYHFSSASSNLWLPFYTNFKNEINSFYYDLRTKYNYTPEAIIENAYNSVISKLGTKQYNIDFNNKYLCSTLQHFAFGNRWTKFKKWIKDRFAFCDSYFSYSNRHLLHLGSTQLFTLKVGSPQYVQQLQEGRDTITKLVISEDEFGGGSEGATNITLCIADSLLVSSNLFSKTSGIELPFGTSELMPYLVSIDAKNNQMAKSMSSLINTNSAENLSVIDISNSSINSLEIGSSVKKVLAYKCSSLNITTTNEGMLEELDVHESTFGTSLVLNNLPNLKVLNIKGATLNGLNLALLPNLTEILYDSSTIFGGTFIFGENVGIEELNLSGLTVNTLNITSTSLKVLDCRKTKFLSDTFDISTLGNIEHLLFNGCTGLKWLKYVNTLEFTFSFNKLKYLGLKASTINALGTNNTMFDCSSLSTDILATLKTIIDDESNDNVTTFNTSKQQYVKVSNSSTSGELDFRFEGTNIEIINNLIWNLSGYRLFNNCKYLRQITNSTLNIINSAERLFGSCREFTFINSTFDNSDNTTIIIEPSVTNALYAFLLCDALDYSLIEPIIGASTSLQNFKGIFLGKKFTSTDIIDLTKYSNATDMESAFSMSTTGGINSLPIADGANSVEYQVVGTLPSSLITCSYMFYSASKVDIVDFDTFLSTATNLNKANSTFVGWKNKSVKVTSDFFSTSNSVLKEISGLFSRSKVYCDSTFRFPSTVTLAYGTFYASEGFTNNTDVTYIWEDCDNLIDIGFTFYGCPKVYASGISFKNNSNIINTTGLFGLSAATDTDAFKYISQTTEDAVFQFELNNKITLSSSKVPYPGAPSISVGMFEYRYVPATNIFNKINSGSSLTRLFYNSITHFSSNIEIDIDSLKDCSYCFSNTKNREQSESTENSVSIIIKFKSGESFKSAFAKSIILEKPITDLNSSSLPSTVTDTTSMYSNCTFANWNGELVANYFEKCSSNLANAVSMFANCLQLKILQYNSDRGLFSNCTNLTSGGLKNIFLDAWHLLGGIPNNLFGVYSNSGQGDTLLTNITDLTGMFLGTSIFYKITRDEDFETRCITQDTFKMVPKILVMSKTFANIRCEPGNVTIMDTTSYTTLINGQNITYYNIDSNAFGSLTNLTNISKLFYRSSMIPNISFSFGTSLKNISDAFYDTRSFSGYLTLAPSTDSLKQVENASNTFGTFYLTTSDCSQIDAFIAKLLRDNPTVTSIVGIVYQRANSTYADDISNKYKAPSDLESRRYDGKSYIDV